MLSAGVPAALSLATWSSTADQDECNLLGGALLNMLQDVSQRPSVGSQDNHKASGRKISSFWQTLVQLLVLNFAFHQHHPAFLQELPLMKPEFLPQYHQHHGAVQNSGLTALQSHPSPGTLVHQHPIPLGLVIFDILTVGFIHFNSLPDVTLTKFKGLAKGFQWVLFPSARAVAPRLLILLGQLSPPSWSLSGGFSVFLVMR